MTAAAALVPPATAWAGKRIVDAVVARNAPDALRWVFVEFALVATQTILQRGLSLVSQVLGLRLGIDVNVAILEKAVGLELPAFEDSEFYDKMTRARREASSRPLQLVRESFGLAQSVVTFLSYAALLVRFSPWVVLVLLAATIPATAAEMHASTLTFQMRNRRSQQWRRLTSLEHALANDEPAKEVKLFSLGPPLLARYRALSVALFEEDRRVAIRRTLGQILSLLATVAFYAAYAFMGLAAAAGRITLGNLTLYVVAFRQGQQAFQAVLSSVGGIYEQNLYMANLFEFLEAPTTERTGGKLSSGEPTTKTTLVKLLTRLYEPTEGRILLDGKDLREWDVAALRARFGIVFQDFNQYQLSARDNVALGDPPHSEDEARIERAVDEGGAAEVVAALPRGLETALGHWFKDGTELSGGQWQKIALSRAFMRQDADILVLDEPTASLDAKAEHRVFERLRALARGRTTIVISHRFPTVRMADRIIVLERGRLVEEGTHDELIAAGGRYARMFELQASGYR